MSLQMLHEMNGRVCSCGKTHSFSARVIAGDGALSQLPQILKQYNAQSPFILCDPNTYRAAGQQVCALLDAEGLSPYCHVFREEAPEPDEYSVGNAVMHMKADRDIIIGVGSGVINDIGKILSSLSGKPYIIVATAPSMDGYASATSSMTRDGLKISLPSRGADVILGDSDILCQAPMKLLRSGLGDMLAKYISICEWRIAHLLLGEYYCEEIADLVRSAVAQCVSHAEGLLRRDKDAVMAVFEGLIIGGVAMNYAGLSRPASGVEHYISHVLDMRAVEFGKKAELHGLQCAVGTLIAARLYEKLLSITPDKEKALAHASQFDFGHWSGQLRQFFGKGAESMIALEAKEKKYDLTRHRERLDTILEKWEQLLAIICQEIPKPDVLDNLYRAIGLPKTLEQIGADSQLLPTILRCTKDIRDKYVLSRLAWDLGIEDVLFDI